MNPSFFSSFAALLALSKFLTILGPLKIRVADKMIMDILMPKYTFKVAQTSARANHLSGL